MHWNNKLVYFSIWIFKLLTNINIKHNFQLYYFFNYNIFEHKNILIRKKSRELWKNKKDTDKAYSSQYLYEVYPPVNNSLLNMYLTLPISKFLHKKIEI